MPNWKCHTEHESEAGLGQGRARLLTMPDRVEKSVADAIWGVGGRALDLRGEATRAELADMTRKPACTERDVQVDVVGKWLERIGDAATNTAELVMFMDRGTDLRHSSKRIA